MRSLDGIDAWRRRGRARLVAVAVALALLTACSDPDPARPPTGAASSPAAAVTRDHWPTAGWRTAAPQDRGIDPATLTKLDDDLTREYVHVRSFLVVRHGDLVYERYRRGLDATSGHDVRSVTKSVIGALVGIAIAEGRIKGLEQTVGELLPTRLPADADPRVAGITVGQLLTMTSGIYTNGDSVYDEGLVKSVDWIRHILGQKLENDPGVRFGYSDASAHVLSAIVATVSGRSTLAYARDKLFGPLGIRTDGALEPPMAKVDAAADRAYERAAVAWPVDPQGYHFGAALLRLPSRELAKLGFLYLNGGRWEGAQLVPADYVAAATSPEGSSPNLLMGYGRLWWVGTENGHRTFSARGLGGQYVYVVPDLDLVLVVTSDVETRGLDPIILISGFVAAVKG